LNPRSAKHIIQIRGFKNTGRGRRSAGVLWKGFGAWV